MKCSIIIVSWNTCDLLRQCLQSIHLNPPEEDFETIVIDNDSKDGSADMVRHEFPTVSLLINPENLGFAAANNRAIRQAQGEYLLLLNSDAELTPGAAQTLIRHLDNHPSVGIAGPRLEGSDGRLQINCARASTPWREWVHHLNLDSILHGRHYALHRLPSIECLAVDVLQAACALIRKTVVDQIGGFDEQYFMYSEDDDFCERTRNHTWDIHYVPTARVIHHSGGSTRRIPETMFIRYYTAKCRFYRLHRSRFDLMALKIALFVSALIIVVSGALAGCIPGKKTRRIADIGRRFRPLPKALRGM